MNTRNAPDWVKEVDAINPGLLDEYRDDPGSLSTISAYLSRFPNAEERAIVLEILANARIRFDDPMATIFMGLHELNVRMLARQFRGVFSDAQALSDRANELRKATADLTLMVTTVASEIGAELRKVAGMPTDHTEKLRLLIDQKLDLLDKTAGAGIDNLESASRQLLELTGNVNQALSSLANDLGKRLDETSAVLATAVDKRVGSRLDEILEKVAEATNKQAKGAAEEALAEIVEQLSARAKKIDDMLATTEKNLTQRLGSIDMRTVTLPPLVQKYLDVATLPRSVVYAVCVVTAVAILLGGAAGFRYGQASMERQTTATYGTHR